jgi:hypothetical protein
VFAQGHRGNRNTGDSQQNQNESHLLLFSTNRSRASDAPG